MATATVPVLNIVSCAFYENSAVLTCATVALKSNENYATVALAAMVIGVPQLLFLLSPILKGLLETTEALSTPVMMTNIDEPLKDDEPVKAEKQEVPGPERDLMTAVEEGLDAGVAPTPLDAGLGGALLLKNAEGENVAVFKPRDQEYGCADNRKGHASTTLGGPKRGIPAGQGYLRERAAYLVAPDYVPTTTVASLTLPGEAQAKVGSLQAYVPHDCDAEDIGTSGFSDDEVHKLALLDLRLGNCDRHLGNVLVQRGRGGERDRLVAIDHGCVLPETLEDLYFGWQFWSQAARPLSAALAARVASWNPAEDTAMLRRGAGVSEAALLVGEVCGMFARAALAGGARSVRGVAEMMTRGRGDTPSVLEGICARAAAAARLTSNAAVSETIAPAAWDAREWCDDAGLRAAFVAAVQEEMHNTLAA